MNEDRTEVISRLKAEAFTVSSLLLNALFKRKKNMQEIWKDIPNYEGIYQASNLGNIKSLSRKVCNGHRCYISKEKQLKPCIKGNSYFIVNLFKNNKTKTFYVHKLIAITFLNYTPDSRKIVIDHINNIKTDNRLENLQIVTQRYNISKIEGNFTSKYKGVCWDKSSKKWKSAIRIGNVVKYLGLFNCELKASIAYQNELKIIENEEGR